MGGSCALPLSFLWLRSVGVVLWSIACPFALLSSEKCKKIDGELNADDWGCVGGRRKEEGCKENCIHPEPVIGLYLPEIPYGGNSYRSTYEKAPTGQCPYRSTHCFVGVFA